MMHQYHNFIGAAQPLLPPAPPFCKTEGCNSNGGLQRVASEIFILVRVYIGSDGPVTSRRPGSGTDGLRHHGGSHGVYPDSNLCKRGALQHRLQETLLGQ